MSDWTFADVWRRIARRFPDAPALVHGERRVTWSDFARRAAGLATWLVDEAGLARQDKVAQYLPNRPEYLESVFAAFQGSFVPVNTNYRYTADELRQLWDDADVRAVVFDGGFGHQCEVLRPMLPKIRAWLWVDPEDGSGCPEWATPYEVAAGTTIGSLGRPAGDDLYLLYTGGTTGMPKGVMWRQDDLFAILEASSSRGLPDGTTPERYVDQLAKAGPRVLIGAPLMHGTASWFSMSALNRAGAVVTVPGTRFDPVQALDVAAREDATGICVVGDAFVRPMLQAIQTEPERWDLSRLRVVFSSGVMFSAQSKQQLRRYAPRALIVDSLATSESGVIGRSVITADEDVATATFQMGPNTRVVDAEGRNVEPGSGVPGRLAVGGRIPLGYYKDEQKTKDTFLVLDGQRFVVAGDFAEVLADGAVRLLGRGSACINTGGEKVYPEEVEEVLKSSAQVADAAVVGAPDERFGETVVAFVQPVATSGDVDVDRLLAQARQHLAGYKIPRRVHLVDTIGRSPSGKVDIVSLRTKAATLSERMGNPASGD